MPGRSQQKERERKRAAVFCQTLDVFLPTTKRKTTADGQQSSSFSRRSKCCRSGIGDDCRTSELVASESDGPEITTPYGTSTEPGNLEEPDPEVLSIPKS